MNPNANENDMTYIQTRLERHIGTITMNHPEHRNALSGVLMDEIVQAFLEKHTPAFKGE